MTAALARMVMTLACCCLGKARREWALAMQEEFVAATEEGKPLAFAVGCLVAAFREMPRHAEGRFVLANHGLALGIIIPIASLQLLCATGYVFAQGSRPYAVPTPSGAQAVLMTYAYLRAVPSLLSLWLLLGVSHFLMAWALLERDWQRVIKTGSLIAAGSITLLVFTAVLGLDDARPAFQAATLAIELMAVAGAARLHDRLSLGPAVEPRA